MSVTIYPAPAQTVEGTEEANELLKTIKDSLYLIKIESVNANKYNEVIHGIKFKNNNA